MKSLPACGRPPLVLARAAPERTPPEELRDRVLSSAIAARAAGTPSRPPVSEGADFEAARESQRWRAIPLAWWSAAAAAVMVFALGFGGGTLFSTGGNDIDRELHVYNAESGAWLEVVATGETSEVTLGGLPTLDAAQAYQLWVIRDGIPQSLAVIEANVSGPWVTSTSIVLATQETVAVTLGPSGGGDTPIGDPVLSSGGS